MPNLTRSRPQDWFHPFRKLESAKLAADEVLAAVLHFEIFRDLEGDKVHNIFAVIRKGDKAIARNVISHHSAEGYCDGHADEFAEYPIENEKDLINEVRDHGLMIAIQLEVDPSIKGRLSLNTNQPAFFMQIPKGATNAETAAKMDEDTNPAGTVPKHVIKNIFGLEEEIIPAALESATTAAIEAIRLNPGQNEAKKGETNLEKAAKEMELIKKYGKKPMQELAKKIGYQGEVINKSKTKTNAN